MIINRIEQRLKNSNNSIGVFLSCFGLMVQFFPIYAHHQLGLPHYLYSEEYPQIPTMVIDADAEGYVVTFAIFPGNPNPGQVVRIKVYIKHKNSGTVYTKPITMSISTESFLRGESELIEPQEVVSEYNEFKMSYLFDEAEKYFINVTFEPRENFFEKIPFPMVIGKTDFKLLPLIILAFFIIVFLLVGFTSKNFSLFKPKNYSIQ